MPVAREGWPLLAVALAAAAAAHLAGLPVAAGVFLLALAFLIQFFRDPERSPEGGEETIVSPADGTVLSVEAAGEAPAGAGRRVAIFMSVFNCHVNRSPIAGRLTHYLYAPGRKRAAFQEKASAENEQNRITVAGARGSVTFKQIAGALARRIVFYPRPGMDLARAQRIGMIKFGSRVDLFVPDECEVLVKKGDKVKAGQTGIARWK
ncbi:MAG: phosphatidylserine decarboxylase [Thermoanaerobaculia bacterium]